MNSQKNVIELYEKLIVAEKLSAKLSELNAEIRELEGKAYESMLEEGIDSIKHSGVEFKPIVQQNFVINGFEPNTKWDDIEQWFDWLESIGEGGVIKTKKSVHPGTRTKLLREYLERDKENILPDFIRESFYNTVKYNKSLIKRIANTGND